MDDHFQRVELKITIDEFHRLPRNPAYKFEYFDGHAVLTPRPKSFTCVLDLPATSLPEPVWPVEVRPLPLTSAEQLGKLYSWSVRSTQPFASLSDDDASAAAQECFTKTLTGGDGPVIGRACFQAISPRDGHTIGGLLVTLVPSNILTNPFATNWQSDPPTDAIARHLGCPHLTWVFVHPWEGRHGYATAMLAAATAELLALGFRHLASTFQMENAPSALWHWRNGFRLLPQYSALAKRMQQERAEDAAAKSAATE